MTSDNDRRPITSDISSPFRTPSDKPPHGDYRTSFCRHGPAGAVDADRRGGQQPRQRRNHRVQGQPGELRRPDVPHAQAARHGQRRRRRLAGGHLRRPGHQDQQHPARPRPRAAWRTPAGRWTSASRARGSSRSRSSTRSATASATPATATSSSTRPANWSWAWATATSSSRRSPSRTNTTDITISQDGTIERPAGRARRPSSRWAQLKLTQFVNPQGLQLLGGSIYTETEASGPPIDNIPGEDGTGQLLQGFLEASNVDPVKELVTLIKTQRAFELNSQSIQTADQALQTIANLRRGDAGSDAGGRRMSRRRQRTLTDPSSRRRHGGCHERTATQHPQEVPDPGPARRSSSGRRRRCCTSGATARRSPPAPGAVRRFQRRRLGGRRRAGAGRGEWRSGPNRCCREVRARPERVAAGATLELRGEASVYGGEVQLKQVCRWSDADAAGLPPGGRPGAGPARRRHAVQADRPGRAEGDAARRRREPGGRPLRRPHPLHGPPHRRPGERRRR